LWWGFAKYSVLLLIVTTAFGCIYCVLAMRDLFIIKYPDAFVEKFGYSDVAHGLTNWASPTSYGNAWFQLVFSGCAAFIVISTGLGTAQKVGDSLLQSIFFLLSPATCLQTHNSTVARTSTAPTLPPIVMQAFPWAITSGRTGPGSRISYPLATELTSTLPCQLPHLRFTFLLHSCRRHHLRLVPIRELTSPILLTKTKQKMHILYLFVHSSSSTTHNCFFVIMKRPLFLNAFTLKKAQAVYVRKRCTFYLFFFNFKIRSASLCSRTGAGKRAVGRACRHVACPPPPGQTGDPPAADAPPCRGWQGRGARAAPPPA